MKKRTRLNEAGFSLVEIIVVLAITAVITSMLFVGINLLNSRPVDECARKLKIALENNRVTTMGKLSACIHIYKDTDGSIMVEEVINGNAKKTHVGEKALTVKYVVGSEEKDLATYPGVTLEFDRSSGALKAIASGEDAGEYVTSFIINRGDKKMEIEIERLTGRISVK